jgi:fructose-1,6-bisphosphatase/inositol monophosphatase family enzyme
MPLAGARETYLEAAIVAVSAGLSCAMRQAGAGGTVSVKDGVDIVTSSDVAAEDAVRDVLLARCPDVGAFNASLQQPWLLGAVVDPLHLAAGAALAEAAGACVSDAQGNPWNLSSASCVAAATPALHADLLVLIASSFGQCSTESIR